MLKKLASLAIVAAMMTSSLAWAQAKKYQLVRIVNLAEQEVAAKMLTHLYKDAGLEVEIQPVPGDRARADATTGSVDGETLRIFSYGEKNPTMVRVPTPYSSLETTAFALKSRNIKINTKDDLRKYRVVIVRGVQHTRDVTQGLSTVHEINDGEQMMKFLDADRADIAITNTITGLGILKKLKNTSIAPSGTLNTLELFHYLHEKNKDLVPKIDAVIKDNAKSGELKKMRDKYEKEYLDAIQ